MIEIKKGNIFTTNCQTIVNTINCVGVMGAGIAYEFRLRYPELYQKYKEHVKINLVKIGTLWLYKSENKWILNFPTKYHWKYPSKVEYLEKGLQKFVDTYKEKKITSIAFPLLGATHGGIPKDQSIHIMKNYLESCDIKIEIWYFDKNAKDDLYEKFKNLFESLDCNTLSKQSGIRKDFTKRIKKALDRDDINSISGLLREKGIGDKTLEKTFKFIMNYKSEKKMDLFDYTTR